MKQTERSEGVERTTVSRTKTQETGAAFGLQLARRATTIMATQNGPFDRGRIRLGMVGGGEGAFIGAVHRTASRIDDAYEFSRGAVIEP